MDNIALYTLPTLQTTSPSGAITFTTNGGATVTYTAPTFILAQQVQGLVDAFLLSPDSFIDLSTKLSLQLYQVAGAGSTVGMIAGTSYLMYGAGFQPGSMATLTNGAGTVTLPVALTFVSPGMVIFVAPDNTVPPYNALDTADTNVLTVINSNGQSAQSGNATTPVLFGWT